MVNTPLLWHIPLSHFSEKARASLLQHPAMQWATNMYRLHRGHSAEAPRGPARDPAIGK
jgi:hypothetical protein